MFHLIFDVTCGYFLGIGFSMVFPKLVEKWKLKLLSLFEHKCD